MNLRTKTSLAMVVFIVIILFTYTFLLINHEKKTEKRDLLSSGKTFAELTSMALITNYERYYHNAFYSFLSSVRRIYETNTDLYKIEIADVNGNILMGLEELTSSAPATRPRTIAFSAWEFSALMSITPEYRFVQKDERDLLEISYPVLLQGGVHKHNIFYYYSFEGMEQRIAKIRNIMASLALLFVLIAFLGASLFSYGLTRNLGKLVSHAHLIAEGNLDEPITVKSKDELGELASSFEYMRIELNKKNREIESHNRRLEEKVKERTTELEKLAGQLKENNVILQRANDKLMELDKLKSEFLANTSHELRTPLTSIIGYSQCVLAELDGPLPPAHKGNISKILRSGKDLLALINRILDFSKIESGRISLHKENVNMKVILEEAVTTVRPMSEEKGLSVISNVDPELPPFHGDRMRLKQAVINLLANAVKFTEKGFIEVNASRRNGDLKISVRDTGIGISAEDQKMIFEAFRQVDGSVQRKFGGSGLGLTIAKRLIELHSGRLHVESKQGEGTIFSFTLPMTGQEVTANEQVE